MARRTQEAPAMFVLEVTARATQLARRTDLTDRRVMLLVRDPASVPSYEHLFKLFGATMIPVASGAELIERLPVERPDAIAYELDAPEAGLHLIRRIRMRSRLDGGGTPALAMTSAPVPQMHTRVLLAGFQGYVLGDPLELLLAVARVVGERAESN